MSTLSAADTSSAAQPPVTADYHSKPFIALVEGTVHDLGTLLAQQLRRKHGYDASVSEQKRHADVIFGYENLIDEFPRILESVKYSAKTEATRQLMTALLNEERGWDEESGQYHLHQSHAFLFREITFDALSKTLPEERPSPLLSMRMYAALKPLVELAARDPIAGLVLIYALYALYQDMMRDSILRSATALKLRALGNAMYFAAHKSVILQMEDVLTMLELECTAANGNPDDVTAILEPLKDLLFVTFNMTQVRNAHA